MAKSKEVIAEKQFPNSGVIRRLWTLGRLELTLVVTTAQLFIINTQLELAMSELAEGRRIARAFE